MAKILVIDDDIFFQEMLSGILPDYQLQMASSGEEGLQLAEAFQPELILLDIQMDGIDGYETCRLLREQESTRLTPVVFISNLADSEDRIKAYSAGGADYISKPFNQAELTAKIERLLEIKLHEVELREQLSTSYATLMDIQRNSSKIQSVSRFVQASLFCHDIESLFQLFFHTTRELGESCILAIRQDHTVEVRSDTGSISRLENDIMNVADSLPRIHSFGHNRAIYNWPNATLLARNVDDMIDILAILMDAVEAAVKAIHTETLLLDTVHSLELENDRIKDQMAGHFEGMLASLKETFLSLGVASVLDQDEEDRLYDLVEHFQGLITSELDAMSQNGRTITELVQELRSPPEELDKLLHADQDDEDQGGMVFF